MKWTLVVTVFYLGHNGWTVQWYSNEPYMLVQEDEASCNAAAKIVKKKHKKVDVLCLPGVPAARVMK